MRRTTPKIFRDRDFPTKHRDLGPLWEALWSAMGSRRGGGWFTAERLGSATGGTQAASAKLLTAAHRVKLVRRRTLAGIVAFARVDVVAQCWSTAEELAYDKTGWRWNDCPTVPDVARRALGVAVRTVPDVTRRTPDRVKRAAPRTLPLTWCELEFLEFGL